MTPGTTTRLVQILGEEGAPDRREISLLPLSLRDLDPDTPRGAMNHKSWAGCLHWASLRQALVVGVTMLIRHNTARDRRS